MRQTGKTPSVDDSFLWRICHAIDETPQTLAANIGLPYEEVEPLLGTRHLLVEIDRSETWFLIARHVDKRLGYIMAVREELSRSLQRDRVKRVKRVAWAKARDKKPSPRRG